MFLWKFLTDPGGIDEIYYLDFDQCMCGLQYPGDPANRIYLQAHQARYERICVEASPAQVRQMS